MKKHFIVITLGAVVSAACALGVARGIAALPELMRGAGIGPLHSSQDLIFEILNGDSR